MTACRRVGARGPDNSILATRCCLPCCRSRCGWANKFAELIGATAAKIAACGDAETKDVTDKQLRANYPVPKWHRSSCPKANEAMGEILEGGRCGWSCKRHVKAQMDWISDETTDLVLLTLGGNDMGQANVSCLTRHLIDVEKCQSHLNAVRSRIDQFCIDLIDVIAKIKPRMKEGAKLVLLCYPLCVLDAGHTVGGISPDVDEQFRDAIACMNQALANAAEASGDFVTVYPFTPEDWAGHEVDPRRGSDDPERWMCEPSEADEQFHVNPAGHEGWAAAMASKFDLNTLEFVAN